MSLMRGPAWDEIAAGVSPSVVARLRRQAAEALGEAAEVWLTEPNPALGGEIPIQMARTDIGAREVEAVLGRLAHGVFG
jgi:putative toxin-antitoxin system antitoxin component (TIGR02293 family)